jgi:hypothetical protein
MPVITQIPFDVKSISLSVERDAARSKGIHLSSIIKDRLITAGIERKVKGKQFTPEEQHLLYERGFLWERMVKEFCDTEEWIRRNTEEAAGSHFAAGVAELPSALIRPGECQLDGIFMTPDAINPQEFHVEEWKATAMRYRGFDIQVRRPEWLWQACSYAAIFGMTKAIFRVWHVSDNVINPISVQWTEEEVRQNWQNIKDHWQHMQERRILVRSAP